MKKLVRGSSSPAELLATVIACGAVISAVSVLVFFLNSYFCEKRWRLAGLSAEYYWQVGCMVKLANGKIVPATTVRNLEQ